MSSVLKCSGCTWASWSLPASASPLRASVSPPPCSCCVLRRLSDSSDYEHKSSTCQELLLPGLCNACLHLEMVWAEDCCKWFAFILMAFQHFLSFNEGSGWWRLSETMKVLETPGLLCMFVWPSFNFFPLLPPLFFSAKKWVAWKFRQRTSIA